MEAVGFGIDGSQLHIMNVRAIHHWFIVIEAPDAFIRWQCNLRRRTTIIGRVVVIALLVPVPVSVQVERGHIFRRSNCVHPDWVERMEDHCPDVLLSFPVSHRVLKFEQTNIRSESALLFVDEPKTSRIPLVCSSDGFSSVGMPSRKHLTHRAACL